jgi:hypothetical protein
MPKHVVNVILKKIHRQTLRKGGIIYRLFIMFWRQCYLLFLGFRCSAAMKRTWACFRGEMNRAYISSVPSNPFLFLVQCFWYRFQFRYQVEKWRCPCNKPWRPIGLWGVKSAIFYRYAAHRWQWWFHTYAPAALHPPGRFHILICVRDWVNPGAIVRL